MKLSCEFFFWLRSTYIYIYINIFRPQRVNSSAQFSPKDGAIGTEKIVKKSTEKQMGLPSEGRKSERVIDCKATIPSQQPWLEHLRYEFVFNRFLQPVVFEPCSISCRRWSLIFTSFSWLTHCSFSSLNLLRHFLHNKVNKYKKKIVDSCY